MAKRRGIVRTLFGTMLNVQDYVSFDEIKSDTKMVANTFKEVLNTKINENTGPADEAFDAALARLNISEQDLQKKRRISFYYFIIYIIFSLLFLAYAVYIFSLSYIIAGLAVLALALFLGTYAIRESCMYARMKKRNFNITAKDWFHSILGIKQQVNANEK